jgi:hypothetical protein
MKNTLLSTGAVSFFFGIVLRFNAENWGWESVSSNTRTLNAGRVVAVDQAGLALSIFGLLVCLLVIHHILLRDEN